MDTEIDGENSLVEVRMVELADFLLTKVKGLAKT